MNECAYDFEPVLFNEMWREYGKDVSMTIQGLQDDIGVLEHDISDRFCVREQKLAKYIVYKRNKLKVIRL